MCIPGYPGCSARRQHKEKKLAWITHESPAPTADMDVIPGVLGSRTPVLSEGEDGGEQQREHEWVSWLAARVSEGSPIVPKEPHVLVTGSRSSGGAMGL